jgi:hypothetical protein
MKSMVLIQHAPLKCAWLLVSLWVGCAGKTTDPPSTPLATCGSSCSAAQINDSCSSTCAKMIQVGCSKNQSLSECTHSCADFGGYDQCPAAVEFLRCAESVAPTCVNGVPDFGPTCTAHLQEAEHCGKQPVPVEVGGGTAGGPPVPTPVDDPSICPNIPRPATGGGGCVGTTSGSAGFDAATTCTSACQDGAGNLWEATCSGATCSCVYNHTEMCTCMITGASTSACSSCCPGTF